LSQSKRRKWKKEGEGNGKEEAGPKYKEKVRPLRLHKPFQTPMGSNLAGVELHSTVRFVHLIAIETMA
jgi:hypothetical protein